MKLHKHLFLFIASLQLKHSGSYLPSVVNSQLPHAHPFFHYMFGVEGRRCVILYLETSGFATTHVLVIPSCKMAVQSPLVDFFIQEVYNVSFVFPANREPDPDFFQPKTFPIPRGMIPQNFSSLGFAVSQELGNKQTYSLTH